MNMGNRCLTRIFLAGDSTMQSYPAEKRPQYGWGELLLQALEPDGNQKEYHREDCPFPMERVYEGSTYLVDNCAMAGRSSRSFREEGRLDDIASHLQAGDILIVQFGHNDASQDKKERYVAVEDFDRSLRFYTDTARTCQAVSLFISALSMRRQVKDRSMEVASIEKSLEDYRNAMAEAAQRYSVFFIDGLSLTREYQDGVSYEECEALYREDGVHLVRKGAAVYAGLLASHIRRALADVD